MANASTLLTITPTSASDITYYDSFSSAIATSSNSSSVLSPQHNITDSYARLLLKRACPSPSDVDCGDRFSCSQHSQCVSDDGSSSPGPSCVPDYSSLTPRATIPFQPVSTVFAANPNSIDSTAGTSAVFTSGRVPVGGLQERQLTSNTADPQTAGTDSYFSSMYTYGTTFTTVTVTAAAPAGSSTGAPSHHHGLSGGAIAGIVIGVLFGLLILPCLLLCCFLQHRRNKKKRKQQGARGLNLGMHDGTMDATELSGGARLRRARATLRRSHGLPRSPAVEVVWPEPTRLAPAIMKETDDASDDEQPFPGWRTLSRTNVHSGDLIPLSRLPAARVDIEG